MIQIWIYSIVGVTIVSLLSLLGVFTLAIDERKLKKILIYFISFSAGALFGDVFIHILPEVAQEAKFSLLISIYFLSGIVISFIIEKIICWNHNHHDLFGGKVKSFVYMVLFGDAIHNFIDGLAIGAGFLASIPLGIATTLAVIFHEIPHEIGDFGALVHGGFSRRKALLYNFYSGLTSIAGTLLALLLNKYIQGMNLFLICFAGANLLYIAGSDLIPELHKEVDVHKNIYQLIFFLMGISIMAVMLFIVK